MDAQLNVGDVVQLKSGGPEMTVKSIDMIEYINKPTEIVVTCQWFQATEAREHAFPSDSLRPVSEQN